MNGIALGNEMASAWVETEEGAFRFTQGTAESMIGLICECGGSFHECVILVRAGSYWEPPEFEGAELIAHIEGDWALCRAAGFDACIEDCQGC